MMDCLLVQVLFCQHHLPGLRDRPPAYSFGAQIFVIYYFLLPRQGL
jgi:hypothetical protein